MSFTLFSNQLYVHATTTFTFILLLLITSRIVFILILIIIIIIVIIMIITITIMITIVYYILGSRLRFWRPRGFAPFPLLEHFASCFAS